MVGGELIDGAVAETPIMSVADALALPHFVAAAITGLLVPPDAWPHLSGPLTTLQQRLSSTIPRQLEREIAARLGGSADHERLAAIIRRHREYQNELRFLVFRCFFRPGWRPLLRLEGRERIEFALQDGRGAILWIGRFIFAGIAAKQAWAAHGYQVSHLYRAGHGFANSRLAAMTINRIWTRVEERYLRERIVLYPGQEARALRRLHRRLVDNGLVSITVNAQGRRACKVPFLHGGLTVATGAASLALATGAPVLPVVTIKEQGVYRTIVLERLQRPRTKSRKEALVAMVRELAARLEPFVQHHLSQFSGWRR